MRPGTVHRIVVDVCALYNAILHCLLKNVLRANLKVLMCVRPTTPRFSLKVLSARPETDKYVNAFYRQINCVLAKIQRYGFVKPMK